jgi:two-component system, cell cycle sensor histidine kinase and response regulator CckA
MATAKKPTALLIEDNPADARLIRELLANAAGSRFQLEWVRELGQGLQRLAAGGIDVILLDLGLPDSEALDSFRKLHAQAPQVPVVVLTGLNDEDIAVEAVRMGAQEYIVKGDTESNPLARSMRYAIERKRVEEALKASEEKYRRLMDSANDAIFLADAETGIIVDVNRKAQELTGLPASELMGLHQSQVHPPEETDRYREIFAQSLRGGGLVSLDVYVRHKSGQRTPVEISVSVVDVGGRRIAQSIFHDITERKRAEEEMRRSEAQLRQAQKMEALGRLAGGVAHDFNNLLTSILGFGNLAKERLPASDPVRGDIEEVIYAGERAAELTRRLLAVGRRQIVQVQPLDLNEIVSGMDQLLRRTLGEDIELVTVLGEDLPSVQTDAGSIEQMILNLAVNARDAMPHGGKLIIETERVHGRQEGAPSATGEYAKLSIRDTGSGMTPDVREHAFEPFFTTKPKGEGTGLGLSTVYGIVQHFKGRIELDSAQGEGTEFRIFFPGVAAAAVNAVGRDQIALPPGNETILAAEDEPAVRRFASRVLRSLGYRVIEADNGETAWKLYAQYDGQVDLIFTDVVMPLMGGAELMERVRQAGRSVKVLYTTGFTQSAIVHHGVTLRSDPVLLKPFTREALAAKIRQVLDGT